MLRNTLMFISTRSKNETPKDGVLPGQSIWPKSILQLLPHKGLQVLFTFF